MAWKMSASMNCVSHKLVARLNSILLKISSGPRRDSAWELTRIMYCSACLQSRSWVKNSICILDNEYHGCRIFGDANTRDIISHGINLHAVCSDIWAWATKLIIANINLYKRYSLQRTGCILNCFYIHWLIWPLYVEIMVAAVMATNV